MDKPSPKDKGDAPGGLLILALIVIVILLMALFHAPPADAAYRAAPQKYVNAALKAHPPRSGTTAKRAWVICHVWGRRHCRSALNVSWCESGLRPWARNGQFLGMMQMGSGERARWGHGRTAWSQARAAHRYWRLAGWRPWSCRP